MSILIILLIIALIIAIVFDVIRIAQYISLQKSLHDDTIELNVRRINSAYDQYQEDEPHVSFGEYLYDWIKSYKKSNNANRYAYNSRQI